MSGEWPKNYVWHLADVWVKRHGAGSAKGVLIRNAFRHLKTAGAPWDRVLVAWGRYVRHEAVEWQQPHLFCRKWQTWTEAPVTDVARKTLHALEVLHDRRDLFSGDAQVVRSLPDHAEGGSRPAAHLPAGTRRSD